MQLIVLGMHRSGTSVLARVLNMMGAYFGQEGVSTGANKENPKGFWERRDVRQLNDFVLHSVGCDWDKISNFELSSLPEPVIIEFGNKAANVVLEMDAHRPWLLKEPRLCLLLDLWLELLEIPVCIHIHRNPLEVAKSLYTRNKIPIQVGIALWEKYNESALSASQGLPRFIVSHKQLIHEPELEVKYIFEQLLNFDVSGLHLPSKKEITSFVRDDLYHEKADEDELYKHLNSSQLRMFEAFSNRNILDNKSDYQQSETGILTLEEYEQNAKIQQNLKEPKEKPDQTPTESKKQHVRQKQPIYSQIYYDLGDGYTEQQSVRIDVKLEDKTVAITFDLSHLNNIVRLRIDPINVTSVIHIAGILFIDKNGKAQNRQPSYSNAKHVEDSTYYFDGADPQLYFENISNLKEKPHQIQLLFEVLYLGSHALHAYIDVLSKTNDRENQIDIWGTKLPSFLTDWQFYNTKKARNISDKAELKGFLNVVGDYTPKLAIKYAGTTRIYALDRVDDHVAEKNPKTGKKSATNVRFEFCRLVPRDCIIQLGIEHDMKVFWLGSVET